MLVLGIGNFLVQFSKDGVDVEDSDGSFDKEFWRQHYYIFIVLLALVIDKGSQKEVCSGVGFAWDVFDFKPVVL